MALVTCRVCGKSFSDTRDKCIHCGAPLLEEVVVTPQPKVIVENKTNFEKLSSVKKLELENEFINEIAFCVL